MTDSSYTEVFELKLLLNFQQQVELKLARESIPWQQAGSYSSSVRVVFPVAGKVSKYRGIQRCSTNISDGFWSMILGGFGSNAYRDIMMARILRWSVFAEELLGTYAIN
ncbi:hypothetical protein Droror1_Dr00024605 [Drosera rotundifolia]